jgi:hypothetical protein
MLPSKQDNDACCSPLRKKNRKISGMSADKMQENSQTKKSPRGYFSFFPHIFNIKTRRQRHTQKKESLTTIVVAG